MNRGDDISGLCMINTKKFQHLKVQEVCDSGEVYSFKLYILEPMCALRVMEHNDYDNQEEIVVEQVQQNDSRCCCCIR